MAISPKQARAARALLAQSQADIHEVTGISVNQISTYELEKAGLNAANLTKLQEYFEGHGLEFMDGGVRERPQQIVRHLEDREGFRVFMNDVYETAQKMGGEICLFNGVPEKMLHHLGADWYQNHKQRMTEIKKNFNFKVLICEGDENYIGDSFVEYRWFPKDKFNEQTIYIYGDKVALISFEDKVSIVIIEQPDFTRSERVLFNLAWDNLAKKIR